MPGVVCVHARVTTLLLLLVRMRACEGRGGVWLEFGMFLMCISPQKNMGNRWSK